MRKVSCITKMKQMSYQAESTKKEKKSKIAMDVYSSNEWEVRNFS